MPEESLRATKFQSDREEGYHRLILWQKGREFIKLLYEKTKRFPKNESFGLQSQTRRAAISFLLNVVEGQRRNSKREFLRFLDVADGSLVEVEACLEISLDLGFLTKSDYIQLEEKRRELAIMLRAFIKGIKKL
jgi:four helix bundle protein